MGAAHMTWDKHTYLEMEVGGIYDTTNGFVLVTDNVKFFDTGYLHFYVIGDAKEQKVHYTHWATTYWRRVA